MDTSTRTPAETPRRIPPRRLRATPVPKLVSVDEFSAMVSLSPRYIWLLLREGKLKASVKVGRRRLIDLQKALKELPGVPIRRKAAENDTEPESDDSTVD